jgi:hypothetical protein
MIKLAADDRRNNNSFFNRELLDQGQMKTCSIMKESASAEYRQSCRVLTSD